MKTLGQVAYEAFNDARQTDMQRATWPDLAQPYRDAFEAAAKAAVEFAKADVLAAVEKRRERTPEVTADVVISALLAAILVKAQEGNAEAVKELALALREVREVA